MELSWIGFRSDLFGTETYVDQSASNKYYMYAYKKVLLNYNNLYKFNSIRIMTIFINNDFKFASKHLLLITDIIWSPLAYIMDKPLF